MKKFIQSGIHWYVFFFQNRQIKRDGGSNKHASDTVFPDLLYFLKIIIYYYNLNI